MQSQHGGMVGWLGRMCYKCVCVSVEVARGNACGSVVQCGNVSGSVEAVEAVWKQRVAMSQPDRSPTSPHQLHTPNPINNTTIIILLLEVYIWLAALRAGFWHFGPAFLVLHALRALRPCDPCND